MKRISMIVLALIFAMVLGTVAVSAETELKTLIPAKDATWTDTPNGNASVTTEYKEDGSIVFSGSVSGTWPCTEHWYATPIVANVEMDVHFTDSWYDFDKEKAAAAASLPFHTCFPSRILRPS